MSETPQEPASNALVTVQELGVALNTTLAEADPYGRLIVEQASNAVRDYAGQAGWRREVSNPPADGTSLAPQAARDVALWVAVRAYTNPRNLSRRGAGPISESYENGLWALELTPAEKDRIDAVGGSGGGGGMWIQPIDGGWGNRRRREIRVPIEPQPGSPFPIADEGQYPYGHPHDGYGTLMGDVEYVP